MIETIISLLGVGEYAVATMFVSAGVLKFCSLNSFTHGLKLIPYFPVRFVPAAGLIVPICEIAVGLGICMHNLYAKLGAICLLVSFSLVAAISVLWNQRIPCNCFGANEEEMLSTRTIVRNMLLVSVTLATCFAPSAKEGHLALLAGVSAFIAALIVNIMLRNEVMHKRLLSGKTV